MIPGGTAGIWGPKKLKAQLQNLGEKSVSRRFFYIGLFNKEPKRNLEYGAEVRGGSGLFFQRQDKQTNKQIWNKMQKRERRW